MGLLGFVGAVVAPFSGKLVDAVVPWSAQLMGLTLSFSGMLIALFTAERSVVAVAISVTMFDCGNQLFQVGSSYRVAGLDPKARARLNGCVLLALFAGQVSLYLASCIDGMDQEIIQVTIYLTRDLGSPRWKCWPAPA